MPPATGELIGMPGARVPGLDASYASTGRGWLGPDGDVVFEAVILWDANQELGCGVLRRGPDGRVNAVLMQNQQLPGTGGGHVLHPALPFHASGDTLFMPAVVEGGTIDHGLFAVPKASGSPELVLASGTGTVSRAVALDSGDLLVEIVGSSGASIVRVTPDRQTTTLFEDGWTRLTTDGTAIAALRDGGAWRVDGDGNVTPILLPGDPAPGSAGTIDAVRDAWIAADGETYALVRTDDPDHPDVLLRVGGPVEVVAACGAAAPGMPGAFLETLQPAPGRGEGVVFSATLSTGQVAVFSAPPAGAAAPVAVSGEPSLELQAQLDVREGETLNGEGGYSAYGVDILLDGIRWAVGIYRRDPTGRVERIVTTDARVSADEPTTIVRFHRPLAEGLDVAQDGRVLVSVGLRIDRLPKAILWALYLGR
jgi:hypothetical protein